MPTVELLMRRRVWLGLVCVAATACQSPEAFRPSVALGPPGDEMRVPVLVPAADAGPTSSGSDPSDDARPPAASPESAPVVGGVDPCVRRNWTFIPKFICDTPACQDVPASAKNPFGAIDGMPDTRYTTGRMQGSDGPENVVLQLPRLASLTGLTLLTTSGDGPATYLVESSLDGTTFQGFQPPVFGAGSEMTAISFPATTMLAVRVTQTGVKTTNWWGRSTSSTTSSGARRDRPAPEPHSSRSEGDEWSATMSQKTTGIAPGATSRSSFLPHSRMRDSRLGASAAIAVNTAAVAKGRQGNLRPGHLVADRRRRRGSHPVRAVDLAGEAEFDFGKYSNSYGSVQMWGLRAQGGALYRSFEVALRYAVLASDSQFAYMAVPLTGSQ